MPGLPVPLYLAGTWRLGAIAPLAAGVRLSVTALSCDGVLSITLLAGQAMIGLPTLAAGMRSALGPTGPRQPCRPRIPRPQGLVSRLIR